MERTHLYFDRDMIHTGKESQTENLAEKIEDLVEKIEDLVEKIEERATGSSSFVQLGRTLTQEGVEV